MYLSTRSGKKLTGPDGFIATAAYGSLHEPNVQLLRGFRDRVLNRTMLGRAVVAGYYAVSPRRRRVVRVLLSPVVWAVRVYCCFPCRK